MRIVVGVADMKLSRKADDIIVTFGLGSCIGLAIYDPVAKVGGIVHYMLPLSKTDRKKAEINPYMFGDTAIPKFFNEAYKLGAKKERLRVVMAGGAAVLDVKDMFNIGQRNIVVARKLLWKNNILIDAESVGDSISRTLYLHMDSGKTYYVSKGEEFPL